MLCLYGIIELDLISNLEWTTVVQGLQSLNMEEGVRLLRKWYIKDQNCIPASYILQPISSILENFFNSRQPKLQAADQADF